MKLLIDENLSYKLTNLLSEYFPDCKHVREVGLKGKSDSNIWNYCKENEFTILSKDSDFRERSILNSFPPKVIWLDIGNYSTSKTADLIIKEIDKIKLFLEQRDSSMLIISNDN